MAPWSLPSRDGTRPLQIGSTIWRENCAGGSGVTTTTPVMNSYLCSETTTTALKAAAKQAGAGGQLGRRPLVTSRGGCATGEPWPVSHSSLVADKEFMVTSTCVKHTLNIRYITCRVNSYTGFNSAEHVVLH